MRRASPPSRKNARRASRAADMSANRDHAAMTPDELAHATAARHVRSRRVQPCARPRTHGSAPGLRAPAHERARRLPERPRICHGGLIFTLADSTFAFACNTYNINTVAAGCSIEFLRPVKGGDVLDGRSRRANAERPHRHLRHSRHEPRRRNRGDVSRQVSADQRQSDSTGES